PQDGLYNVTVRNVYAWEGGSYRLTVAPSMYPQNCSTPRGDVLVGQMPSDIIGGTLRYRILLPPCHAEIGRQWPYALLMHGSNSSDEHWQQLGADEALTRGVALGRLPYMALALPFGGQLANTNTFREGGSYEYVLVDEFMPFIEGNHCLQAERTGRGIGGISRGGFWAFLVAFRHPELFSALGGHSPFFDLYHAPASHNPLALALATPPSPALRVWMDRGQNDYAQLNIDLQHERLTQNGIVHTFQLNPVGQHNNAYWSAHLDDYLAFYSAEWPLDPADLPACAVPAPEDVP
ncbi:MAG: alpha/beta hydrolase, partial [Anaerolineales bacterium]